MSIWIDKEDVTSRWRDGLPPSDSIIEINIDDVEDFLISKAGSQEKIEQRLDNGDITMNTLTRILARAVIRVLSNPQNERVQQWSESMNGMFSQSQMLANANKRLPLLSQDDLSTILGSGAVKAKITTIYFTPGVL